MRGLRPAPTVRSCILAGVCAAALATAPTAAADPAGGNSGYEPYGDGVPTVISGGPVPTMNGVPCVAGHLGTCVSMAQNRPPPRKPSTGVGHSPTVRR
jgi:hypothetical protein